MPLAIVALCLTAAACAGGDDTRATETPEATRGSGDNRDRSASGDCPPGGSAIEPTGPSAQATVLREAEGDQPRVEAVVYPRPDYEGGPWTQWGQGLVLPDGRFLSAIGDHRGADGNSFLFVYEPGRERITRFADVLSGVEHEPGEWGFGKIHGQLVPGPCGDVYLSTYWGTRRGIEYGPNYRGDLLLRLDPATLELEDLGSPLPEHGIPSLAGYEPDGLVYGEAVDAERQDEQKGDQGEFFAFDTATREVVFRSDDERHIGFRNILVDGDGTAYLAGDGARLLVYEPGGTELAEHPEALPGGGWLRASTAPAPDGTVYGVTQDPDRLFALRPDGDVVDLGAAPEYTTSLALDGDGGRFFFVPGAHGDAWETGAPVIAADTATGEQTVLVELNDLAEEELGLTLGGSYSVAVDPTGERLYLGFNAGTNREDPWGEVVLVIVHLG